MILAIPVSQSDVHLLAKKAELLKKFGPYPRHILAVIPDEPVKQPANEFMAELKPLFQDAHFLPVPLNLTGWPIAPNRHFKLAAAKIHGLGIKEAFYFFELDNDPMVAGWLDRIHDEYVEANKPYMGCVTPTRGFEMTPDGPIPANGEDHMVGTGIYPPHLSTYSVKLPSVDKIAPWSRMPMEPFDVAMRHEIVPHAHATTLIQHNWRTAKYRKQGDSIVCDDVEGIQPNESHKKPWDGVSIVIHGCKDGSLTDLLLKNLPIDSVKAGTAAAGASAADSSTPRIADVQPSGDTPKKQHPTFLGTQIGKLVSAKSQKIADIAKALSITNEQVEAEIANTSNGLVLSGKAKWVKKI
jgi:hypothetical protein